MNKRVIGATVGLERAKIIRDVKLTQGDRKSHIIYVGLSQDVEIKNYEFLVFYNLPSTSQYPVVVDKYVLNESKSVEVIIPDIALKRTGVLTVEFALKHLIEDSILTVSEKLQLEIIGTTNGAILEALPGENIQLQIDQQLEKIDELLKQADNEIDKYNNNSTEKLESFNQNDKQKTSDFNNNADKRIDEYNTNATSKTTDFNNNAKTKATEFDTHVKNTTDHTYLEMDKKATEYANSAGTKANSAVIEQGNIVLGAIRKEGSNQVGAVTNAGSTAAQAVTNEGIKQVELVETKGTEEVEKIQTAGTQAVDDVNANKEVHVKAVTDEGNKQVELVETKGTEEVEKIQTAGTQAVDDVNANKEAHVKAVTDEGNKQSLAVQNQGTVFLETIINIQKQIEQLLKNQEVIGNALALNGKTGVQYDKEIQSVAGMNFDPDLQYLNDAGTKKVGFCYLDRLTDGIFECIKQTTAVVNDSACFRNFSSKENSDRLGNLKDNSVMLEKKINDVDTSYKAEDKKINNKINNIRNVIKEFHFKKYGVKFTGSNPVGERTYDAVGMVANVGVDEENVVNDFDEISFYNRPVCCGTHDENGNFIVNAYEGEPGFTRDGSNGDVYYECTPFYWNGSYEEPVVSAIEFVGSKLAPMFNSVDEKVYLPCYWASITQDGKYRSISGAYPKWTSCNTHMDNCRKTNINAHTETIKAHMTEYILQLVEFATKDLQSVMMGVCNMVWEQQDKVTTQETTNKNYVVIAKDKASAYVIGQTITNSSNWDNCRRTITKIEDQQDDNSYLYFENQEPLSVKAGVKISSFPYKTGATDNIKASSGSNVSNTDGKHQCKWRGKEAPWADGFSILCDILRKKEDDGNYYPYLLRDPKKYKNGTLTEDYIKLNYMVAPNSGWAKNLDFDSKYPYAALTSEVGAGSSTYLSAYYWNSTNPITVAFAGGSWGSGRFCSPVYFGLTSAPSGSDVDRLARLFVTPV